MALVLGVWALVGVPRSTVHRPVIRQRPATLHHVVKKVVRSAAPTTTVVTVPTSGGSLTLSERGPGMLPQTAVLPNEAAVPFVAAMRALWHGVQTDSLSTALPAFFPEAAYLRLKTVGSPKVDYVDRLLLEFQLDINAAHHLLGSSAGATSFVGVEVPTYQATWIAPGNCLNDIGYYHVAGSRLLYRLGGVIHSIGIDSMISWRGQWYVVHFGTMFRTTEIGHVEAPAIGPGTFGPPGSC